MFPLNGLLDGRLVGFGDDHVDEGPARQFLVQPRRGEVHVPGDEVAGLDQDSREDVFRAAALVGGNDVAVPVNLSDGILKMIEVAAARVGLIAEHHPRPLPVAHCAGAAVGEEVDVHVLGSKKKRVVARLAHRPRGCGASISLIGSTTFTFQGSAHERRGNRETAMGITPYGF